MLHISVIIDPDPTDLKAPIEDPADLGGEMNTAEVATPGEATAETEVVLTAEQTEDVLEVPPPPIITTMTAQILEIGERTTEAEETLETEATTERTVIKR